MAKAKCLSIDQMQYLVSTFNVDTSGASMCWVAQFNSETHEFMGYESTLLSYITFKEGQDKVAFDLNDILDFFPKWQLTRVSTGFEIIMIPNTQTYSPGISFPKALGKTPLEAAYRLFVLALRKHYI